jgi:hypothetical protein
MSAALQVCLYAMERETPIDPSTPKLWNLLTPTEWSCHSDVGNSSTPGATHRWVALFTSRPFYVFRCRCASGAAPAPCGGDPGGPSGAPIDAVRRRTWRIGSLQTPRGTAYTLQCGTTLVAGIDRYFVVPRVCALSGVSRSWCRAVSRSVQHRGDCLTRCGVLFCCQVRQPLPATCTPW